MYAAVLFLHSWLRWLVLAAALVVLIRSLRGWLGSRPWTATDTSAGRIFTIVLDVQLLLGLILYAGLSPITWAALSDMGAAMRDGLMRYWAVSRGLPGPECRSSRCGRAPDWPPDDRSSSVP